MYLQVSPAGAYKHRGLPSHSLASLLYEICGRPANG